MGGPPNSGKSTFSESLARALRRQGVSAEAVDLDPWSPTLALIRGEISKEERDSLKRKRIGPKEIHDAARRLKEVAKGHDFVVGDAPGGISDDMRPVYQAATHAIILCREDRREEIDDWKIFSSRMDLRIVAVITSRTAGTESVEGADLIEGTLVGLERNPVDTPVMRSLAAMLRLRLGL